MSHTIDLNTVRFAFWEKFSSDFNDFFVMNNPYGPNLQLR